MLAADTRHKSLKIAQSKPQYKQIPKKSFRIHWTPEGNADCGNIRNKFTEGDGRCANNFGISEVLKCH